MKKYILYIIVPLMLMAACTSGPAEGSLYHRYADRKGLSVAEVDGFQLCDTVRVDVVMLQADSDEAWREILVELSIKDTSGVTSWLGDIDEPARKRNAIQCATGLPAEQNKIIERIKKR